MSDPKVSMIIERIWLKTTRQEIAWKESSIIEGEYLASFPSYSVGVMLDEDKDAILKIYSNGTTIEEVNSGIIRNTSDHNNSRYIKEIYRLAKREALGVDKALEQFLQELE